MQLSGLLIYVIALIFTVLSVFSFAKSALTHEELTVMGLKPIYIISGSMESGDNKTEVKKDSVIISKKITQNNIDKLKPGDVITFNIKGIKGIEGFDDVDVTHRLVEINDKTFITKGDANDVIDSFDTNESSNGSLLNSRIKYKMVMRNNWISKVINTFKHKPFVFILYTLSILVGLIIMNVINKELYDKDLEFKLNNK